MTTNAPSFQLTLVKKKKKSASALQQKLKENIPYNIISDENEDIEYSDNDFELFEVPGDGNCGYHAIINYVKKVFPSSDGTIILHMFCLCLSLFVCGIVCFVFLSCLCVS